jgi:hypothetical protein
MAEELLQIRVTADFKEAEGAFLRLAKVATSFEGTIKTIAGNLNKDFNRINGMAELFGDTSNVVKDKMEALKRAMNSLMTSGFQALNPEVQKLKAQYDALASSLTAIPGKLDNTGKSVKKSNQQFTNFALVLQDLPYGFRGIQNNLPALVGGIAGAAGPIYLIASALIAFTTAYEKEITSFIYGISSVDSAQQRLNVAISDGIGVAKAETATNSALLIIINDVTKSTNERKDALELLKDKYKGNIQLQKTDINDGKALIEITDKISDALLRRARAEAFSKLIAEEEAKIFKLQSEQGEQVVKNLGFLETTYQILKSAGNGVTTSMNITTAAFNKQGKEISKAQGNVALFTEKLKENTLAQIKNKDAESLDNGAAKIKKDKKVKEDPAYYTKIIEQEQKTFTDSLDNELKYADDNSTKKVEILQRYTSELNYWHELGFIQESFYLNKAADLHKQLYDTRRSIAEQDSKEQNTINERNLQNSLDALKIQSDVETKILLKGGKSTAAERIKILEDYKNKLYDLASVGGYTAAEFDKIDDALIRVNAAIDGSKDKLKDYKVSMVDVTNSLNTIIRETLTKLGTSLGENIGKMLSQGGGIKDVMNSFLGILADGLIQIGQLAIATGFAIEGIKKALEDLNPVVAIAAGIALVALGTYVKGRLSESSKSMSAAGGAKAFANGGIVSGPTMGLIGEYPGASSNPEVVAPLDKLKDIIGGGGGSFVLRGSDLVLALNRSESSLNLRRGS